MIRAGGLLAAALASHDHEAPNRANVGRRQKVEQSGKQTLVQIGNNFANQLDADSLAPQGPHLGRYLASGSRQVILIRRALNTSRNDLSATGEVAQYIDVLQDADETFVVANDDATLVELGHKHER
ncbi:hypothetical protein BE61_23040 [Bradyrhizobium elkanii USDA 61]|nr:hypothetical protein BE61_23040 [Bradyrhizobium elkanii USDA 61]